MEYWQLKQKQSLPLAQKVRLSEVRIRQWYEHWHGQVYVSFSGGKDSTVLLHLVRALYPRVPAVFVDTGLEYPEVRKFVKNVENVIWIKPKKTFKHVLEDYGYPIISKETSQKIHELRVTKSAKLRHKRLFGDDNKYKSGRIPLKWQYLKDAPFKISDRCCYWLKKSPAKAYEKKSGLKPFLGTMACDSHLRRQSYLKHQCNMMGGKDQSRPLSVWTQDDIWAYIRTNSLPYSCIYDMGVKNTGCVFCMFGVHLEAEPNRFQRMKTSHPKLWNYCINKLKCGEVLDYINIPYGETDKCSQNQN
jgi:3'-phosphoadenosine 5'-phosphosulfate sulfotransferase (PAPS reductase)/FAD synthetase